MSAVGATFNQKVNTTSTEVNSIAPLEPLAIVKIQPPNVSFIGGEEINYGSLNYLRASMEVGDSSFTKPGTFHVRVLCDELDTRSDWYEVTAHDYSYSADGSVLTAACSEGDVTETLTITAPVKKVYGDGKNPKAAGIAFLPLIQ